MLLKWQFDVAIAGCLAIVLTLVFWNGYLDVELTRPFFDAQGGERWPLGRESPWSILYKAAPWITASLVFGGLFFLGVALVRGNRTLQRQAIFVTASVVLGPGLLVNGLFKDHWNRPRPRDVIEFGGTLHYAPAPLPGAGGKSFPCGHCSVGFLYALGWWLWRKRLAMAITSATVGLTIGIGLGVGRMAAGGHFPSDIAWSAFISFGIAHWLYWYVLRIPAYENSAEAPRIARRTHQHVLSAAAGLSAVGVLVALFVTAHGALLEEVIALEEPPQALEFSAASSDVRIVVVDSSTASVRVSGETHGFGLPRSRLQPMHEFTRSPVPTLRYSIEQQGWFTDLDCRLSFEVPATDLRRIVVRIAKGNVSISDRTSSRVIGSGRVRIDAHTGAGQIRISD
ncbi:MAG TPA: phosphatase PAP2 family protein [Burkholderiales bacterium]|nr:phosphatase PAP2 family protein [Burkholderiales bacterium]